MGNCAAKRVNNYYPSSLKVSVPDLSYLNRKNNSLLTVLSQEISQFQLKGKIKIYNDSAISWLFDGSLIVGGGSDSSSCLTRKVFLITPASRSIKELARLPIPVKLGHFVKNLQFIYYLGGVVYGEDNDSNAFEEASPLMRYNEEKNLWEIFRNQNSKQDFEKFLNRKVCEDDGRNRISLFRPTGVSLKDLMGPGVAVYNEKIYLIGGKVLVDGRHYTVNSIFSFSIHLENVEIREEDMKLPVKLWKAQCSVRRGFICIAGGYLENELPNMEIFLLDLNDGSIKALSGEIERPLEDNYPVCLEQKGVLCFSPPKLMYVRQDKKKTYAFLIPTLASADKEIVVEKKTEENAWKVHWVDLTIRINSVFIDESPQLRRSIIRKSDGLNSSVNRSPSIKKIEENLGKPDFIEEEQEWIFEEISENQLFCENNHLLSSNNLGSDQNITPKPLSQCSFCKVFLESLCYECKICNYLVCFPCSKWISTAEALDNPLFKCFNGHNFFKAFKTPDSLSEPSFFCCCCNENKSGLRNECKKCNTFVCGPCETLILNASNKSMKCSEGHGLEWKLFIEIAMIENFICSKCDKELDTIGCFLCGECGIKICINCVGKMKKKRERRKMRNREKKKSEENFGNTNDEGKIERVEVRIEEEIKANGLINIGEESEEIGFEVYNKKVEVMAENSSNLAQIEGIFEIEQEFGIKIEMDPENSDQYKPVHLESEPEMAVLENKLVLTPEAEKYFTDRHNSKKHRKNKEKHSGSESKEEKILKKKRTKTPSIDSSKEKSSINEESAGYDQDISRNGINGSIASDDPFYLIAPVIEESYATDMIKALKMKIKSLKDKEKSESESKENSDTENKKDFEVNSYRSRSQSFSSNSGSQYEIDFPEDI